MKIRLSVLVMLSMFLALTPLLGNDEITTSKTWWQKQGLCFDDESELRRLTDRRCGQGDDKWVEWFEILKKKGREQGVEIVGGDEPGDEETFDPAFRGGRSRDYNYVIEHIDRKELTALSRNCVREKYPGATCRWNWNQDDYSIYEIRLESGRIVIATGDTPAEAWRNAIEKLHIGRGEPPFSATKT
jgi:hypothetical protein